MLCVRNLLVYFEICHHQDRFGHVIKRQRPCNAFQPTKTTNLYTHVYNEVQKEYYRNKLFHLPTWNDINLRLSLYFHNAMIWNMNPKWLIDPIVNEILWTFKKIIKFSKNVVKKYSRNTTSKIVGLILLTSRKIQILREKKHILNYRPCDKCIKPQMARFHIWWVQ